jgi:hypothetical protein
MPENTLPFGYIELHKESGKEDYDLKSYQQSATRVFRGPWADRQDFIKTLLPGINEANGEIGFSDPGVYPAITNLIASKVHADGAGKSFCTGPDGMIEYEEAILTVTYEYVVGNSGFPPVITYPFPNFTIVTGDITSEIFTFQKEEVLNKADANDPPIKELRFLVPTEPITIKILFHPSPKFQEISDAAGRVNVNNFILPKINRVCGPETLLFLGMIYNEKGFLFGRTIWELDYKFLYRKSPHWNQVYNRKGTIVRAALLVGNPVLDAAGDANDPYKRTDFNLLFNQQQPNP